MDIVYYSATNNVRRFIAKTGRPAIGIVKGLQLSAPFVLVTPTIGFGQVPPQVSDFLQHNSAWLRGVAASGNRNWGATFAAAAEHISREYGVPIVLQFELSGTPDDVDKFIKGVDSLSVTLSLTTN